LVPGPEVDGEFVRVAGNPSFREIGAQVLHCARRVKTAKALLSAGIHMGALTWESVSRTLKVGQIIVFIGCFFVAGSVVTAAIYFIYLIIRGIVTGETT